MRRAGPAGQGTARLARLFLLPGSLWMVALFVIPLVVLVLVSFATTNVVGLPVYGFHPGSYSELIQSSVISVLIRSLEYAALATIAAVAIGYPTAYTIARYGGRFRNALILLAILPWFVDYLVRIYAWLQLLGQSGLVSNWLHSAGLVGSRGISLTGNAYAVIGGLTYDFLPLMILPVYVAVEQLDKSLIEAGKDLFGTPRATFRHVTLPMTIPGVLSGCLLVFLPATGDFATAQLLGGPSQYMIGNLITTETSINGSLPLGAALAVGLVAVLAVVIGIYLATIGARTFRVGENPR
jgi:spermidine/putrescine transport system permease protein